MVMELLGDEGESSEQAMTPNNSQEFRYDCSAYSFTDCTLDFCLCSSYSEAMDHNFVLYSSRL